MLTGKHKIGDRGVAIEFSSDDAKESTLIYNAYHRVALDSSELRQLRDILNAHFGDDWVPCGPDGPFPAVKKKVLVTVLDEAAGAIGVTLDKRVKVYGDPEHWLGDENRPSWCNVIAWRPMPTPYSPEDAK